VATVRDTTSVRAEPVIVLPVQYFGRPAALHQPERRLMLAARLPQRDAPQTPTEH
jgi:hypothetical protein